MADTTQTPATAKMIVQETDRAGNAVYPYTKVAAIIDFFQNVVSNGGDQENLKGIKDFADGLKVNGKKVLVDGDVKPFELSAGGIPGDDIFQITTSGIFYYTEKTKNVPHFEPLENSTGYILSVFQDNTNYGLLFFLGSFTYIEKWAGTWRTFFSPQPVKLWAGNAKTGDKVTLADTTDHYKTIRFTGRFLNNPGIVDIPASTDVQWYVTHESMTADGKGLYVDEANLQLQSDHKTFLIASRKYSNTALQTVVDHAEPFLIKVEGIR